MSQNASSSKEPQYRIFLSHAGEDKKTIAIPLYEGLRKHGISVFLDKESFRLGDHCPEIMELAMKTAPVGVFILSPEFVAKRWPMRELLTFVRRYERAKDAKEAPPLLISIFYRFSTRECRDPTIFDKYGDLFLQHGLFGRAMEGNVSLEDVKHALDMAATFWSIENDLEATNDSQPNMISKRESFIKIIQNKILAHLGIKSPQVGENVHPRLGNQTGQNDVYTSCNMVPPNPPRLTLDYASPTTCEGRLRAAVLGKTGSRIVAVVATGKGGVGKTCALRGLAEDSRIKQVFLGGILYLELGHDASISSVVQGIANTIDCTGGSSLANEIRRAKSVVEASQKASKWFCQRSCLFLVDDIWHVNGIDSGVLTTLGLMVGLNSRMVYTTRDKHFLSRADHVIVFKEKETLGELSRQMLLTHAGFEQNAALDRENQVAFEYFLTLCQGLPLGFGIVGSSVLLYSFDCQKTQDAWSEFYNDVLSHRKDLMDTEADAYGKLPKIVDLSLQVLEKRNEHGKYGYWFRALSVLQKQQSAPIRMLQKLWDLDTLQETQTVVESFADVSVVELKRGNRSISIKLHDLILDIAARKATEENETERFFQTLLRSYRRNEKRNERDNALISSQKNPEVDAQPDSVVHDTWARKRSQGPEVKNLDRIYAFKRFRSKGNTTADDRSLIGEQPADIQRYNAKKQVAHTKLNSRLESDEEVQEVAVAATSEVTRSSELCHAWWNAEDDGYLYNNLCRILRLAGYVDQLLWLLSQPQWIAKRLLKDGVLGVERDLEQGRAICNVNASWFTNLAEHLQVIGRAARLSARFVHKNPCMEEAWFQLHGRLMWHTTRSNLTRDFVQRMEKQAQKPWLKASATLLQQAGGSLLQVVRVPGEVLCTSVEPGLIWILSVDRDNRALHVGKYDRLNEFYKHETLEDPGKPLRGFICASFLPDQRSVVAAHKDGRISKWHRETGVCQQIVAHSCLHHKEFIDFLAAGTRIACHMGDASVQLSETLSGEKVGQPLHVPTPSVECVAISADGFHIFSGSDDNTIRVWDARTGTSVGHPLRGHTKRVNCLAVSADGTLIVSGSDDNTVRVWNAQTGVPVLLPLRGHTDVVNCVAVSKYYTSIVSGSDDNTVCVWDAQTGNPVWQTLRGHTARVNYVAVSPNGTRIVSGSDDGMAIVWDAQTDDDDGDPIKQPFQPFRGQSYWLKVLGVGAYGFCIVADSYDHRFHVWDIENGYSVVWPLQHHLNAMKPVAVSADGTRVVSCSSDEAVLVWDAESGNYERRLLQGDKRPVKCLALSADGSRVVSASIDDTVLIWDLKRGGPVGTPLQTSCMRCLEVSADGSRIVSGSYDNTVRVWDLQSGNPVGMPLYGHKEAVTCVTVSTDGTRIVSGSEDNTVRVWDAHSGNPVGQLLRGHRAPVKCIGVSADGTRVVSASRGTVHIWDAQIGEVVQQPLQSHTGLVRCVAEGADGTRIVSGSDDNTLRVWDARTGNPVGRPLEGHTDWVKFVAVSANCTRIVSGSYDNTIRVWNAQEDEPVGWPLQYSTVSVKCVAVNADGTRIVLGLDDNTVRVLDAETCNPVWQPRLGHEDWVRCVALSADGTRIVSGSWDKTVRVWDAQSGEPVGLPLRGHTGVVECVAVSPDGTRIVSGSEDRSVRVWDAQSGCPVGQPLRDHTDSVSLVALSADGSRVVSEDGDLLRLWALNSGDGNLLLTSRDAAWQRTIATLDLTWSSSRWGSFQREVCDFAEDGSKTVLGSCEHVLVNINCGDVYFTDHFASCRVVR